MNSPLAAVETGVAREPARRGRARVLLGCVWGLLLATSPSFAAAPRDTEVLELADQAIFTDYLQLEFDEGERKLLKAIRLCEGTPGACSETVQAQAYRDLAVIYITGMKRQADGKALLVKALRLDPRIALDADLTTPDLIRVFSEAKEQVEQEGEGPAGAPEPSPEAAEQAGAESDPAAAALEETGSFADASASVDCPPDFPGCEAIGEDEGATEAEDEGGDALGIRNWLSAGLQQDFLLFSGESGVCGVDRPAELSCYRAGDAFRDPRSEGTAGDAGKVSGGFRVATTRLLIGYERRLLPNISAGVRIGYAIGGGPAEPNGPGFVPVHAELRGNYWFSPLGPLGIRPYASLSGGLAQVDSSVTTELVDRSNTGQLARSRVTVWKKTGTTFASLGGGAMYPLSDNGGITAELKGLVLFPSSGLSVSVHAGYSHGF